MNKDLKKWFVYIIQSTDQSLYTGITTDITRRWNEHLSSPKGAKFFRGRKPEKLLFVLEQEGRSEATKTEISIKKLKRSDKLKLINSDNNKIALYKRIIK